MLKRMKELMAWVRRRRKAVRQFRPSDSDVCLASYPRSGNTWMRFARMSLGRFLVDEGWRWLLATGLFSGLCWGAASLPVESNWTSFFLRVGGVMVLYAPVAWVVLLRKEDKKRLVDYVTTRLPWRRKATAGTSAHASSD